MKIEEAVRSLKEEIKDMAVREAESVSLIEALGRVLAEDVRAAAPVPDFDRSAMDGYAVRAADVADAGREHPAILEVIGELMAGDDRDIAAREGTAVRIMTGAAIPQGYDTVVMQEDTDLGMDRVFIYRSAECGMNVSLAGEDIKAGERVLEAGCLLQPAHLGVLASLGMDRVQVRKGFCTSIISTGSEVMLPGQEKRRNCIYNNSAVIMAAVISSMGLRAVDPEVVRDDVSLIRSAIEKAADSSVIITTGGVSVGKRDLMPSVLEELGARILFRGVDIQPGTPTIGAIWDGKLLLCLSGNPFAALANFEVYFPEAAAVIMGCPALAPRIEEAVMDCDYNKVNRHTRLIRAGVKLGRVSLPSSVHFSSAVSNLTQCNCLIELEAGRSLSAGDRVRIRYLT